MLSVLYGGANITAKVDKNSVKVSEALNNRTNTASFRVSDMIISEGAICEIREGTFLRSDATATNVLELADVFPFSEKFRPGTVLFLDFESPNKKRLVVNAVDYSLRTITIDQNVSYLAGTKIGRIIFG